MLSAKLPDQPPKHKPTDPWTCLIWGQNTGSAASMGKPTSVSLWSERGACAHALQVLTDARAPCVPKVVIRVSCLSAF